MVCHSCEAKKARWVNAELAAYPFVRSNIIMIIQRIECRIFRESAYALNTSELVQNAPDREIHMDDIKSSYLKRQIYSVVKYVTRNSTPLCQAENGKDELLWPIFHVRPAQPVFGFNASGVPEFRVLEYFSEFCCEIEVRRDVDVYGVVEYFFRLVTAFVKSTAGIGSVVLFFIGYN